MTQGTPERPDDGEDGAPGVSQGGFGPVAPEGWFDQFGPSDPDGSAWDGRSDEGAEDTIQRPRPTPDQPFFAAPNPERSEPQSGYEPFRYGQQPPSSSPPDYQPAFHEQPPPSGRQTPYSRQDPYGRQTPYGDRPGGAVGTQPPLSESDARLWSTIVHVLVPITGFVGPLLVWLLIRDRSRLVAANAAEALNFSILYSVAQLVAGALTVVVIGYVLLPVISVLVIVFAVLGAISAGRAEEYRYPFNVDFVRARP